MKGNLATRCVAIATLLTALAGLALAEVRTWTDDSGGFSVSAELVAVEGDKVVLRRADGRQIEVPIDRLSAKDRQFIQSQRTEGPAADGPAAVDEMVAQEIAKAAKTFFGDLRTTERDAARQLLTKKAQPLMEGANSPLAQLPQPSLGSSSITVGRAEFSGAVAEIPVRVSAGGKSHKTKLHFRNEDDAWRIFAISATYPDGEKSINFEAEVVAAAGGGDPLQSLLGKPITLAGYTLDGKPLDMSKYAGKVVLVDFWATWCGPCRAEIPNILENWKKHHGSGFEVIAISVDQDLEALQAFVAREQPPWAVVADCHPQNTQLMGTMYGIRGIPAFILVGRDGKVAAVNCRGPKLGQEVAKLLGAPG